MSNDNAEHVILRDRPVENHTEEGEHPRQEGGLEDDQAQEAQAGVRVLAAPNVDQGAIESRAEEAHGEHGSDNEQHGGSVGEEP